MSKIISLIKANKFNTISWGLTFVLVVSILFGGYSWKQSATMVQALQPESTKGPDAKQPNVEMPAIGGGSEAFLSIARNIELKTNSPADKPRYTVEDYRVSRGDSVFAIAESYKLKPETILWANYDVLQDTPDSLRPGQVLKVPPTDGIYYQWKTNDTLESVAKEYKANIDDIVNYQIGRASCRERV